MNNNSTPLQPTTKSIKENKYSILSLVKSDITNDQRLLKNTNFENAFFSSIFKLLYSTFFSLKLLVILIFLFTSCSKYPAKKEMENTNPSDKKKKISKRKKTPYIIPIPKDKRYQKSQNIVLSDTDNDSVIAPQTDLNTENNRSTKSDSDISDLSNDSNNKVTSPKLGLSQTEMTPNQENNDFAVVEDEKKDKTKNDIVVYQPDKNTFIFNDYNSEKEREYSSEDDEKKSNLLSRYKKKRKKGIIPEKIKINLSVNKDTKKKNTFLLSPLIKNPLSLVDTYSSVSNFEKEDNTDMNTNIEENTSSNINKDLNKNNENNDDPKRKRIQTKMIKTFSPQNSLPPLNNKYSSRYSDFVQDTPSSTSFDDLYQTAQQGKYKKISMMITQTQETLKKNEKEKLTGVLLKQMGDMIELFKKIQQIDSEFDIISDSKDQFVKFMSLKRQYDLFIAKSIRETKDKDNDFKSSFIDICNSNLKSLENKEIV